jgi:parvulin-like peptidyl-prolyl isomerase
MPLIINGEEIDEDIVEAEFRQVKAHYERTLQVACCERDPEFRGYAKDNIISRTLLTQAARNRFPEVSEEEVTDRLQKLIAEAGGESQFYMNIGLVAKDEAAIRPNIANGVRLDKTLGEVYQPEPTYSESELRAWFEAHLELFMTDEQVRAAHITKNLQGAQSREAIFKQLRDIRQEILNGADFMTLAERDRADEQQQIDLGWFKRGEFMEEFEVIAFSMNEGEVSPVFTTQLGLHLCTVLGRNPPKPMLFEDARSAVLQRMLDEYRDQKFNVFLEELKASADIVNTDPPDQWSPHDEAD